jgi:hypothetical protein
MDDVDFCMAINGLYHHTGDKPYAINHTGPYGVWHMVRKPDYDRRLDEECRRTDPSRPNDDRWFYDDNNPDYYGRSDDDDGDSAEVEDKSDDHISKRQRLTEPPGCRHVCRNRKTQRGEFCLHKCCQNARDRP